MLNYYSIMIIFIQMFLRVREYNTVFFVVDHTGDEVM